MITKDDPFDVFNEYLKGSRKINAEKAATQRKKTQSVFCKRCQQTTNHNVLYHTKRSARLVNTEQLFYTEYYMIQCQGCRNVCLVEENYGTKDWSDEAQDYVRRTSVYPNPHKTGRKHIDKTNFVPESVKSIYIETITAFNLNLSILTAMGLRATIEAICIDGKIAGKNLEKKIDQMVEANHITADGAKLLHLTRDIGNFSAHEMEKHQADVLSLCLTIIENVITNLWVFPRIAG